MCFFIFFTRSVHIVAYDCKSPHIAIFVDFLYFTIGLCFKLLQNYTKHDFINIVLKYVADQWWFLYQIRNRIKKPIEQDSFVVFSPFDVCFCLFDRLFKRPGSWPQFWMSIFPLLQLQYLKNNIVSWQNFIAKFVFNS